VDMRRKNPPEGALYVRLPANAVEKLHRAAAALGVHKKDLVAGLVSKYVDPDSERGLTELTTLSRPQVTIEMGSRGPTVGAYTFRSHDDPDGERGRTDLTTASPRRVTVDMGSPGPTLGAYSFQPYDPPEVMSAEQAAEFLQVPEKIVVELAESGKLPGRKLGSLWRFSRDALVNWLATPEKSR
jgi:excisionase family DNA binding protein